MPEPPLVTTFTIDTLLTMLNDELHGKKNAFVEAQKIRHINKAVDEMWKVLKELHRNYFSAKAVLNFDTINTSFVLPADFAEVIFWEITSPVDYAGLELVYLSINSPLFKTERQSFNAAQGGGVATLDSIAVVPGQLNYTILGPGPDAISTQSQVLLARQAPVALTLNLFYIRALGSFSIPKNAAETLSAIPSPYIWNMIVYAAKSLLKSEGTDPAEYQKWEQEWREAIERAVPAASDRQTADADVTEGFIEL